MASRKKGGGSQQKTKTTYKLSNICNWAIVKFYIWATANFGSNNMDFRGFDSSIILSSKGGMLMSIGNFPEMLSQAILVGTMFVGRLGVNQDNYRIKDRLDK